MSRHITKIALMSVLVIGLIGCGKHENPLDQVDPDSAAHFLNKIAIAAKLKLNMKGPNNGYQYSHCMKQRNDISKKCERLYREMVNIGKKNPDFSDLTYEDIKDQKVWAKIRDYFGKYSFNSLG